VDLNEAYSVLKSAPVTTRHDGAGSPLEAVRTWCIISVFDVARALSRIGKPSQSRHTPAHVLPDPLQDT